MATTQQGVQTDPETGRQYTKTEVAIPDVNLKPAPTVTLAPDVAEEMVMRTYLRKDGVFVKDLKGAFSQVVGTAEDGTEIRETKVDDEQAEAIVRDLCEKSGRTVVQDFTSSRPKAVPGWRVTIHVPGMDHEEQFAAKSVKGEDRLKIAEGAVVRLEASNQELVGLVKGLGEQVKSLLADSAGANIQPSKPLGQMNHEELDECAAANKIFFPVENGPPTKSEKVKFIQDTFNARINSE